ncbi:MAG: hypothetical protein Q4D32_06560 [Eubacteriales bacterium]|nr:hypothetical protein [Eubacteriales bacterium]
MEEKYEEILAQYSIQIKSKRRVRGAILLETGDGLRLLRSYNGHRNHLAVEEQIKQHLVDQGYPYVDQAVMNEQGDYLTRDGSGGTWIMRRWYAGKECDIRDAKEVRQAAAHLGRLHQMLVNPLQNADGECELEAAGVEGAKPDEKTTSVEENATAPLPYAMQRQLDQAYFAKRNRELKRIHSYIRKKRQKNDMELALLNSFSYYYEQGCEAEKTDAEGDIYHGLYQQAMQQGKYIHGSYNYHNLLIQGKRIATTNFENTKVGIQVLDLYGFLRKVMEKNGWKSDFGIQIMDAYQQNHNLSGQERNLLYTLLLYPEKYWKQCNFYYNGKKSWMSDKNYNKLLRLQEQEKDRQIFLETIKGVLF